ncbi:MAG: Fic family protein [Gammaproteobacteria bacterium]|nr:Fic family protein [Gammaproteobacteria bacterium]
MISDRYDASDAAEGRFEPGSGDRVLCNLRGIVDPVEMERLEAAELARVLDELIHEIGSDHRFTAADIRAMHARWLGGVYAWAGRYRSVNVGKDGFPFAAAYRIEGLMADLETRVLARCTPCRPGGTEAVAAALAEVHDELILAHPFREGNGRISRLLATLMALQAGLPLLEFSRLTGPARDGYLAAVQAGLDRNYRPMTALFTEVISAAQPA